MGQTAFLAQGHLAAAQFYKSLVFVLNLLGNQLY